MGHQSVQFSCKVPNRRSLKFECVTPTCWSPSGYLSMDTDCAAIIFKVATANPGTLYGQAAGNDLEVTT